MNLHEYQAKRLFAEHGVPIPEGKVARSPLEARDFTRELGGRVVVKAQVHTGGRGKAGGVKLANSPDEAEEAAAQILGMDIKGFTVNKVLIDQQATTLVRRHIVRVTIEAYFGRRRARETEVLGDLARLGVLEQSVCLRVLTRTRPYSILVKPNILVRLALQFPMANTAGAAGNTR